MSHLFSTDPASRQRYGTSIGPVYLKLRIAHEQSHVYEHPTTLGKATAWQGHLLHLAPEDFQ